MAEQQFKPIDYELNDLRREREILTNELLEDKNNFAQQIRDVLGEQIKNELAKKEEPAPVKKEKKTGWFKRFLDGLSKVTT